MLSLLLQPHHCLPIVHHHCRRCRCCRQAMLLCCCCNKGAGHLHCLSLSSSSTTATITVVHCHCHCCHQLPPSSVAACHRHLLQPLSNVIFATIASPPPCHQPSPPPLNATIILYYHSYCCHPSPLSNANAYNPHHQMLMPLSPSATTGVSCHLCLAIVLQ